MTDLMHHLTAARPGEDELERMWSSGDRADLLSRITSSAEPRQQPRRRPVALALVAAASVALVGVVALPGSVGRSSAATDLHALALEAASYDGPVLGEGVWLHERSTSLQRDVGAPGPATDTTRESWTRWDGRVLLIEHRPSAGWTSYDVVDADHEIDDVDAPAFGDAGTVQDPTPQLAATLPRDAEGLLAYLGPRVTGSSSHDEALYAALVGLVTSHTLPPQTLAAAYEALARVPGVRTASVGVEGRPAVDVGFDDDTSSSTEAFVVDRSTGRVLSASERSAQGDYTSTTTLSEVVAQVPADVLDAFRTHREGVRYGADGDAVAG